MLLGISYDQIKPKDPLSETFSNGTGATLKCRKESYFKKIYGYNTTCEI